MTRRSKGRMIAYFVINLYPNNFNCEMTIKSEDILVFQLVSNIFEFSGIVPLKHFAL